MRRQPSGASWMREPPSTRRKETPSLSFERVDRHEFYRRLIHKCGCRPDGRRGAPHREAPTRRFRSGTSPVGHFREIGEMANQNPRSGSRVDEISKRIHGGQRLAGKRVKACREIKRCRSLQLSRNAGVFFAAFRRTTHQARPRPYVNLVASRDQHFDRSLDYSLTGSPYGNDVFDDHDPCAKRYGASDRCHVKLVPGIRAPALVVEVRISFTRRASDHHVDLALERKKSFVRYPYLLKRNVGPSIRLSLR